jgi:hypothetical protein
LPITTDYSVAKMFCKAWIPKWFLPKEPPWWSNKIVSDVFWWKKN